MWAHAPRGITQVVATAWRAATRQKPQSSKAVAARLVITPVAPIVYAIEATIYPTDGRGAAALG